MSMEVSREFVCLICFNDENSKFLCCGFCNHKASCGSCAVINRKLYNNNKCIVCKENLENVVITKFIDKNFNDYSFDSLRYSKIVGCYFEDRMEMIRKEKLFLFACPVCHINTESMNNLKQHVLDVHKKTFCLTCLKKRKVFIINQRLYNENDMRRHQKEGDPAVGDEGAIPIHMRCKLCRDWLYDLDDHNYHMIQNHQCCQICRRRGDSEKWFVNDRALVQHYITDHLTCEYEDCPNKPLENVFENELDLQSHIIKVHSHLVSKSEKKMARRLVLDFQHGGDSTNNNNNNNNNHNNSDQSSLSTTINNRTNRNDSRRSDALNGPSNSSFPPSTQSIFPHLKDSTEKESGDRVNGGIYSDDAVEASKQIMIQIRKLIGEEGLVAFRSASAAFFRKEAHMQAEQYYAEFNRLFRGEETAGALWMQLVSTLPDFSLRQQLYEIHYAAVRRGGGFNIDHSKVRPQEGSGSRKLGSGSSMLLNNSSRSSTGSRTDISGNGTESTAGSEALGMMQERGLRDGESTNSGTESTQSSAKIALPAQQRRQRHREGDRDHSQDSSSLHREEKSGGSRKGKTEGKGGNGGEKEIRSVRVENGLRDQSRGDGAGDRKGKLLKADRRKGTTPVPAMDIMTTGGDGNGTHPIAPPPRLSLPADDDGDAVILQNFLSSVLRVLSRHVGALFADSKVAMELASNTSKEQERDLLSALQQSSLSVSETLSLQLLVEHGNNFVSQLSRDTLSFALFEDFFEYSRYTKKRDILIRHGSSGNGDEEWDVDVHTHQALVRAFSEFNIQDLYVLRFYLKSVLSTLAAKPLCGSRKTLEVAKSSADISSGILRSSTETAAIVDFSPPPGFGMSTEVAVTNTASGVVNGLRIMPSDIPPGFDTSLPPTPPGFSPPPGFEILPDMSGSSSFKEDATPLEAIRGKDGGGASEGITKGLAVSRQQSVVSKKTRPRKDQKLLFRIG